MYLGFRWPLVRKCSRKPLTRRQWLSTTSSHWRVKCIVCFVFCCLFTPQRYEERQKPLCQHIGTIVNNINVFNISIKAHNNLIRQQDCLIQKSHTKIVQVPVKRRTDNYKLGEFSSRSPISRKAAQQIEPVSDICIVASFYYCRIFYFSTKLPTNYYSCKYSIDFFHENRPKPLKTGTFFFKNKGKETYFLVKTTRITQKENKQQKRPRLQIGISA